MVSDMSRKIVVLQRRRKAGQHLGDAVPTYYFSLAEANFQEFRDRAFRDLSVHRNCESEASGNHRVMREGAQTSSEAYDR